MKWILDILNLGWLQITARSNNKNLPPRIHNVRVTVEMMTLKFNLPTLLFSKDPTMLKFKS